MYITKRMLNLNIFSWMFIVSYCQTPNPPEQITDQIKAACKNLKPYTGNMAYIPEGPEALRDLLPQICKDLNIGDLCNLRAVCKYLKEEVDRLPQNIFVNHIMEVSPNNKLKSTLKFKPKLAMFISDSRGKHEFKYESFPKRTISQFWPEMPEDSVCLCLNGMFVEVDGTQLRGIPEVGVTFFAENDEKMKIRYHALNSHSPYSKDDDEIEEFIKKSFPENWGEKDENLNNFAYIFFTMQPYYEEFYGGRMLNYLEKNYQKVPGKLVIWGGEVQQFGMASSSADFLTTNFGASIDGPGVKSWSLLIDAEADESKIMEKLRAFKTFTNLKSKKSMALCMITIEENFVYDDDGSIISAKLSNALELFKISFPGLTILTYGIGIRESKFCIDSWIDLKANESPKIRHKNPKYICYLVISNH